jgi:hypothetical protein
MPRTMIHAALVAVAVSACWTSHADAQQVRRNGVVKTPVGQPMRPPAPIYADGAARPIQNVSQQVNAANQTAKPPLGQAVEVPRHIIEGYPYLNASMYPCPIPNVPYQVGGTAITNQALHPHEMLYPHEYRAVYPPYYYKVNGHWLVTPWGVSSSDHWELQGTEVSVKYKSHISPFSSFKKPSSRHN